MSRIATAATIEDAPEASQPLLRAVAQKLGVVPNLYRLVAQSPVTLEGLLGLSAALAKGRLPATTRERLAIAIAAANGCDYCLSAHSYIASEMLRLPADQVVAARRGAADDAKVEAALTFARRLVDQRGQVVPADIAAARAAGYSEAELLEIVGHVAVNLFTNYLNIAFDTEIDFPRVSALAA